MKRRRGSASQGASGSPKPDRTPPRLAERLLAAIVIDSLHEAVLGDLAENYLARLSENGPTGAQRWYWIEALRSGLALFPLKITAQLEDMTMRREHLYALVGLFLLIPAGILVSGGLLQSLFGSGRINQAVDFDALIFNPAFILGGILIALSLNLLPLLNVHISAQDGILETQVRLRLQAINLVLIGLISLLAAIIFLYLLAENFAILRPL